MRGTYHAATSRRHTRTKPPISPPMMKFSANSAAPPPREPPARHDPDAHPMDAEGQAAEYPEPEKIQLSIPDAGRFENTVQQPGDGDGQNCLLEKFLDGLGSRHWRHLHSCLHYTGKI